MVLLSIIRPSRCAETVIPLPMCTTISRSASYARACSRANRRATALVFSAWPIEVRSTSREPVRRAHGCHSSTVVGSTMYAFTPAACANLSASKDVYKRQIHLTI